MLKFLMPSIPFLTTSVLSQNTNINPGLFSIDVEFNDIGVQWSLTKAKCEEHSTQWEACAAFLRHFKLKANRKFFDTGTVSLTNTQGSSPGSYLTLA